MKPFTMGTETKRVVTLKEVAARAGLSLATVSYALRRHPKIPEGTREKVAEIARGLGYRPNPRVASLMAHIRSAQARAHRERIAFVWVHTSRAEARENPFLKNVFNGAQERAAQMGFALEEFWTNAPGMTDQRLEQILRARGIVGVVLSPVTTAEATVTLGWDWQHFSAAVIGNLTWTPELHHAGHHHFLAMQMALRELEKLGCRRPAALIEPQTNERAKRAWEAAFLTHHPAPASARGLVRVLGPEGPGEPAAWLRASRADALIVSDVALLKAPGLRGVCRELGVQVITLYWSADAPRGVGGIDQCYDQVAAQAVDLVAAQLNANETGVPDLPRIMLFPGRWVAPGAPGGKGGAARTAKGH
ncbi:MAG: LacI family DNA-binding transcriptional regulator [Undibacterium sp.]|nr:LacI family DNA-binding transcriptional regulator [Opitutaceae bacterium]